MKRLKILRSPFVPGGIVLAMVEDVTYEEISELLRKYGKVYENVQYGDHLPCVSPTRRPI